MCLLSFAMRCSNRRRMGILVPSPSISPPHSLRSGIRSRMNSQSIFSTALLSLSFLEFRITTSIFLSMWERRSLLLICVPIARPTFLTIEYSLSLFLSLWIRLSGFLSGEGEPRGRDQAECSPGEAVRREHDADRPVRRRTHRTESLPKGEHGRGIAELLSSSLLFMCISIFR